MKGSYDLGGTNKVELTPTPKKARNKTLDVLRGFSLLGIIIVNLLAFNLPLPHIDLGSWFTLPSDIKWHQLLDIYVQGSFYPLFAMLFGYGLAMQWQKAVAKDEVFWSTGLRRMFGLFIIGALHALLIWWGDILMMYAVFGTLLLLFLRMQPLLLFVLAFAWNAVIQLFMIVFSSHEAVDEVYYANIVGIGEALAAYGTGTWKEIFDQRLVDLAVQNNMTMWFFALFTIFPYMLLGAGASKLRLVERAAQFKWLWIGLALTTFPLGIYLKNLSILHERTFFLEYIKTYIGGPLTAIGYAAIIVSLCLIPVMAKLLTPFATVGRVSLSTYIGQSIILSVLFYGFGFGLYGKINVQSGVLIAVTIFIVQVVLADLWLRKFNQGPLEALWRKFTYFKLRV